jgi:hypothetical protein
MWLGMLKQTISACLYYPVFWHDAWRYFCSSCIKHVLSVTITQITTIIFLIFLYIPIKYKFGDRSEKFNWWISVKYQFCRSFTVMCENSLQHGAQVPEHRAVSCSYGPLQWYWKDKSSTQCTSLLLSSYRHMLYAIAWSILDTNETKLCNFELIFIFFLSEDFKIGFSVNLCIHAYTIQYLENVIFQCTFKRHRHIALHKIHYNWCHATNILVSTSSWYCVVCYKPYSQHQ